MKHYTNNVLLITALMSLHTSLNLYAGFFHVPPIPPKSSDEINREALQKRLFSAIYFGDNAQVAKLIKEDPDLLHTPLLTRYKDTPLTVAAANGKGEIVRLLIDAGINVNTQTSRGHTALTLATMQGYGEIVDQLLAAHADLTPQEDDMGDTALHSAIRKGHLAIVERLLAAYPQENRAALLDQLNYAHQTALMEAAQYGQEEIVGMLIAAGASLDTKNSQGNTALMYAAERGYRTIIEMLLNAQAKATLVNNDGKDAQDLAQEKGHPEIAALFEEYFPMVKPAV